VFAVRARLLRPGGGAQALRNARKHAELANEARTERLEERMPVFDEWDPEVAAHMRKVGERMLEERRLEVKPSERAGFS
jgi:hypothetical protein